MPVGDLGPEEVVTVDTNATVSDVVEKLDSEGVGSVVVSEDGEPAGIVTDRDITMAIPETDNIAEESVESVMTEDPVTLQEDAEAMELSRTIGEADARRIPIVDDSGQLTGMATLDDLVATIGEQLDNVSETIEVQSPDYSP